MSEFVAGFAGPDEGVSRALRVAFGNRQTGFATADPRNGPVSFTPQATAPKHFHPQDATSNPTEGWDPFDPHAPVMMPPDPLQVAHAAGFAEGFAAASGGRDMGLVSEIAASLSDASRFDRDRIARRLRQTVLHLVTRMIGETGISPELLAIRIDAAARMLADDAESALLRLNPDDMPLVEGRLPATIFAAGDGTVARGSFVLESASTIVEDGPELWLEQLASALDQVAVPAA